MKKLFTIPIRVIGLCVLFTLMACSDAPEKDSSAEPIKIGGIFSLSGAPHLVEHAVYGAQMAFAEANKNGGVNGRPLELLVRDDRGSSGDGVQVAQSLHMREGVTALLGLNFSHVALALSSYSKQHEIVFIGGYGANNDLTWKDGHPYTFILEEAPAISVQAFARHAANTEKKRWAIVATNVTWGKSIAAAFKENLKSLNPEAEIAYEHYPAIKKLDAGAVAQALRFHDAEGVLSVLFGSDLAAFIRQVKQRGLADLTHISTMVGVPEEADFLGAEVPEGWFSYGFAAEQYDYPPYQEFAQRFQKRYDQHPRMNGMWGYVSAKFLIEGLRKSPSLSSDDIAKTLEGLEISTPVGAAKLREVDHRSTIGYWHGTVKHIDGKARLTNTEQNNVNALSPSDEWIKQQRQQNR